MIPFKQLWKGKFLSIISPIQYPYEILNEGSEVIVLPYLINENKIIVRSELCPPYFCKDNEVKKYFTLLSGMVEENESIEDGLMREIQEESGIYDFDLEWYIKEKELPIWKNSNIRCNLYILGLTSYDIGKPTGDGTIYEEKSESILMTLEEMKNIIDYETNYDLIFLMSYYRLQSILSENLYKEGKL